MGIHSTEKGSRTHLERQPFNGIVLTVESNGSTSHFPLSPEDVKALHEQCAAILDEEKARSRGTRDV